MENLVIRLRPAPLRSAIGDLLGLSKRRYEKILGYKFFVNPISNFGLAVRQGEFEPEMVSLLKSHLRPGALFIDLGANEGFFSVIASHLVGASGRVIAVEPQLRLQEILRENFRVNGCNNIQIVRAAVCSQAGTVQMRIAAANNTGSSSLYKVTKYPLPSQETRALTLRDLLEEARIDSCDLMKVDIEGAEYDALYGAEVLERGVIRNIAVEYHDRILERRGASRQQLHDSIIARGYCATEDIDLPVYRFCRGGSPVNQVDLPR
jgi:FkbM family methyltransferase